MLEILHFIFSNFWIWLGSFLMLAIILFGLSDIIRAIKH